ncbi:histidine phosphatase superfamily (branch 1) protein [Gregarina niphandrodes]|uniref:Histidine phosphatase superfamily (Branch 1) protein n=1 Tax=Gregarina niphandrodes TaxID=110365 RepID=A0A023B1Z4_GRENI|nr:histidine phosphatase superfamily (branch 1) protein [Gregarina niphandrodes]EZG47205.1 histidine phosphatase superfamily (branch 1) protein [Gregarina niphandrodes]|eukprot:XP_011132200.1 histidine phosphatase superfamily (branch 1) protein [Gregarina niphandrodes]
MLYVLNAIFLVVFLTNVVVGYYRRQAGYRVLGSECLQWRYITKHLEQYDGSQKVVQGSGTSELGRYRKSIADAISSFMNRLEKRCEKAKNLESGCIDPSLSENTSNVLLGLLIKFAFVVYAVIRLACSCETSDFEQTRRTKWAAVPYDMIRKNCMRRYRVVYIRHGESMWNKLFNRGIGLVSLGRIIGGVIDELIMATEVDSQILDSPLSAVGVQQANELCSWLLSASSTNSAPVTGPTPTPTSPTPTTSAVAMTGGDAISGPRAFTESYMDKCVFLSSNLRRAMSTLLIGFGKRIKDSNRVRVLSCLQETTRNPDSITYALEGCATPIALFNTEEVPDELAQLALTKLNWIYNKGNRGVFERLSHRFQTLIDYLDQCYEKEMVTTFVISGHSLFLKKFVRFLLPDEQCATQLATRRKITNCGMLTFDIISTDLDGKRYHAIDSKSIELTRGHYL